jgi:hypothetical protein
MATQSSAPATGHEPNPLLIFDALNGFLRATALKAAIELEVFTLIGAGAVKAADLAKRAQTSEKGMRVLCDFMTIQGFLTKHDGVYGLTPDSAVFLDKKSPAYLGSTAFFLVHPSHVANFLDLTAAVRKGGAGGLWDRDRQAEPPSRDLRPGLEKRAGAFHRACPASGCRRSLPRDRRQRF